MIFGMWNHMFGDYTLVQSVFVFENRDLLDFLNTAAFISFQYSKTGPWRPRGRVEGPRRTRGRFATLVKTARIKHSQCVGLKFRRLFLTIRRCDFLDWKRNKKKQNFTILAFWHSFFSKLPGTKEYCNLLHLICGPPQTTLTVNARFNR